MSIYRGQVFALDGARTSRFAWTQDLLPDELAVLVSANMEKALPDMKRVESGDASGWPRHPPGTLTERRRE